jgi:hypothetical protein
LLGSSQWFWLLFFGRRRRRANLTGGIFMRKSYDVDVGNPIQKLDYQKVTVRRPADWPLIILVAGAAVVLSGAAIGLTFFLYVWYVMKIP